MYARHSSGLYRLHCIAAACMYIMRCHVMHAIRIASVTEIHTVKSLLPRCSTVYSPCKTMKYATYGSSCALAVHLNSLQVGSTVNYSPSMAQTYHLTIDDGSDTHVHMDDAAGAYMQSKFNVFVYRWPACVCQILALIRLALRTESGRMDTCAAHLSHVGT